MSVVTVDSEGNFHKKIYMKDGYPQNVFKDNKLIFPDFVMINSGGHASYGDLPYKTTIYGGDLGANNLFQPYSSKETRVGPIQSHLWQTEYYTDTVVYGDGCKLVDTFNLNTAKIYTQNNTFPLSSCGDAIALDASKFRDYLSQLDFSSKVFVYCKISADTESVEGYAKLHRLPTSNIDYSKSYEPKIRFGVSYSMLYKTTDENGYPVTGIFSNATQGAPSFKYYKYRQGSSNTVDIECILNKNDIFYGQSDKHLTSVYDGYEDMFTDGVSSVIRKEGIMAHDSYENYILDKVYITPHFEYIDGFFIMKGGQNSAKLPVNRALSGEWGVSFDKRTPTEMVMCKNISGDLCMLNSSTWQDVFSLQNTHYYSEGWPEHYDNTSTYVNSDNILVMSCNKADYPFSSKFVRDYLDYLTTIGEVRTSYGNVSESYNVESYPVVYIPTYEDYLNGVTTFYSYNVVGEEWRWYKVEPKGQPIALDVNQITPSPTGIKYQYATPLIESREKTIYALYDNKSVRQGCLLYGMSDLMEGDKNRQSKMLYKVEFDARLKFKTEPHNLPICLTRFEPTTNGSNYHLRLAPTDESFDTMLSSYKDLHNLYGDDWSVTDEWKHYGFTAEMNYYNMPEASTIGRQNNWAMTFVPYITLWGEKFITWYNNDKYYGNKPNTSPYEVKNVTTKLYI